MFFHNDGLLSITKDPQTTVKHFTSANYQPLSNSLQSLITIILLTEVVVNRVCLLGEEE